MADYYDIYQTVQVTWADVFMYRYSCPQITYCPATWTYTVHLVYDNGHGGTAQTVINIHHRFFGG